MMVVLRCAVIVPALLLVFGNAVGQVVDAVSLNNAFANAADKCKRSVVSIDVGVSKVTQKRYKHFKEYAERSGRGAEVDDAPEAGIGSGVIVREDGYIMTNHHVIDDIDEDSLLITLHDGRRFLADIIGSDPSSDLALLRIYARDLEPAAIARAETVRLGELVLAIGSPLGLRFTVTSGVVSAVNRDDREADDDYAVQRYIQTDAAINPGNSGGGLFRIQGDLIGINTANITETGYNIGYGLAITTDLVRAVYNDLVADGVISRPSLGLSARADSYELALPTDRPLVDESVVVEKIKTGGSAFRAGIKVGDVIRSINGHLIRRRSNVAQQLALCQPGQRVSVGLARKGDSLSVAVDLDTMDLPFHQPDRNAKRRPHLGVNVSFDSDICAITDVARYGPAEHAGLRTGDQLMSINAAAVNSLADLERVISTTKPGDAISVECKRGGSAATRTIIVGASRKR